MGRYEASLFRWRSPDDADASCVFGDPLDGVFGRVLVPSLVFHVVGGRGLSCNVSFARRFPFSRCWRVH